MLILQKVFFILFVILHSSAVMARCTVKLHTGIGYATTDTLHSLLCLLVSLSIFTFFYNVGQGAEKTTRLIG